MTRRLGGNGRKGLTVLAAFALATAMAAGGTMVGCGGGNSGSSGGGNDSGPDVITSTEAGKDVGTDSGPETSTNEGGVDVVSEPPPKTQLGSPTFTPNGGAVTQGSTATINPPTGLPAGGQLYYSTNGTVPTATTGSLYISPIQINADETIIAIAHDPAGNFLDSPPASAQFTITQPEAGTLGAVQFNPTAVAENNDFLVQLSDTPGATICYTLDGSQPACSVAGACTGTSKTYDAGAQVSINGTVTDINTGSVKVIAIACEAGDTASAPVEQDYQLTVADPAMTVNGATVPPTTGVQNVPWNPVAPSGVHPTISTGTFNSITPANAVALWYSTTGAPSCSTGTNVNSPSTLNQAKNTTYQVIGCKTGYHPSNIVTYPVTIQLNTPGLLAGGTFHYEPSVYWAGVGSANAGIDDSANSGSTDVICASLGGTPVCGTNPGGAATCTTGSTPVSALTALTVGNTTTDTTTVNLVACAPSGVNTSGQASQTYKLQFASAFAYTTENLVSPATDLPGWDWNGTGAPNTSMHIPATAVTTGTGYPYQGGGSFIVDVVKAQPCTNTSTATGIPSACTGTPAYQEPDYFCASNSATAAACTCATHTAPAAALPAANAGVTSTAGSNVLTIIGCQATAGTGTPLGYVFSSPADTSVTFSGATGALAPTVEAQVGAPQSVQATVTVTNNDTTTGGSYLCLNFGSGGANVPAESHLHRRYVHQRRVVLDGLGMGPVDGLQLRPDQPACSGLQHRHDLSGTGRYAGARPDGRGADQGSRVQHGRERLSGLPDPDVCLQGGEARLHQHRWRGRVAAQRR